MAGIARRLSAATLCAVALAAGPAWARIQAQVLEFGEITAEAERPAENTDRDTGIVETFEVKGIRFVTHADVVEARLCLRFGVRARFILDPGARKLREMRVVIDHPKLTRPDGASSSQESFIANVNGDVAYAGWAFDHDWEMAAGEWTIAFFSKGERLASQTFTVVMPPSPGSACPSRPTS